MRIKKRNIQYIQKFIASIVIFMQCLMFGIFPASAEISQPTFDNFFAPGDIAGTNPGNGDDNTEDSGNPSIMQQIETRYHIDDKSVQQYADSINVAGNKDHAPQVMIVFSPNSPKPGESVTADANPLYFTDQNEALYFTWYLKHKGCNSENEHVADPDKFPMPTGDLKDACDVDGKNGVTENDWKVEAMRMIASNNFRPCDDLEPGKNYDDCRKDYYKSAKNDNDGYVAKIGGDRQPTTGCGGHPRYYIHDFKSGDDYEMSSCDHLFPEAHNVKSWNKDTESWDNVGTKQVGDGSFGLGEEMFWHTDVKDPSTAKNGNKDEANAVGLGQKKLTWNYTAGDKVGVVVEGPSLMATKYKDSSPMIMFALPKNKCDVSGASSKTVNISDYTGDDSDDPVIIKTASNTADSFNNCLRENLIDPLEGGQAGKLEVSTSFSPENPRMMFVSDKSITRGDSLTVQSSITNTPTNPSEVLYRWRVDVSTDGTPSTNDDKWDDITKELVDKQLIKSSEGNNLSALKVNLNINNDDAKDIFGLSASQVASRYFPGGMGYLRVHLTAIENFSQSVKRVGRSYAIIKVTLSDKTLSIHNVKVKKGANETDPYTISLDTSSGSEFCEEDVVCPVVNGQIIGLQFDDSAREFENFSWRLNGDLLVCGPNISLQCDDTKGAQKGINFFPVMGNEGEVYSVVLTANNVTTGKTLSLNRTFKIVKPSIAIKSNDEKIAWPEYLGRYINLSGEQIDDFSKNAFRAFVDSDISLKSEFIPGYLAKDSGITWYIDNSVAEADTNGNLLFHAIKPAGSVYSVSVSGAYTLPLDIRKAMNDIWRIPATKTVEQGFSNVIQIEMVTSADTAMNAKGIQRFFANIVSYVPDSVLFFARTLVTAIFILLVVGFAFSFVSEKRSVL